jgi:hypothetical protein
MTLESESIDRM